MTTRTKKVLLIAAVCVGIAAVSILFAYADSGAYASIPVVAPNAGPDKPIIITPGDIDTFLANYAWWLIFGFFCMVIGFVTITEAALKLIGFSFHMLTKLLRFARAKLAERGAL